MTAFDLIFALVGSGSTVTIVFFVIFLFPEKVDQWRAIFFRSLETLGIWRDYANKQMTKYAIQGEVSRFSKEVAWELSEFDPPPVEIRWAEQNLDRKAFLDNGRVIIRLRKEDPNSENLATACMYYVSHTVTHKAARYLSPTQRDAVELFVGYKIVERVGKDVFDVFVSNWLYPGIEKANAKVGEYFESFLVIDDAKLFFPIFLQELVYLGDKVFARTRNDGIVAEIDHAIGFLEALAKRRVGEEIETFCNGSHCRFAFVIVGASRKIRAQGIQPYIDYINGALLPHGVETIYLIGPAGNKDFMGRIASRFSEQFTIPRNRVLQSQIYDSEGNKQSVKACLVVLRNKDRQRYVSSRSLDDSGGGTAAPN